MEWGLLYAYTHLVDEAQRDGSEQTSERAGELRFSSVACIPCIAF